MSVGQTMKLLIICILLVIGTYVHTVTTHHTCINYLFIFHLIITALQFCTGPPAMVPSVTIDVDSVNVNRSNNNVSFTLSWTEPFANFDPIVNYTITINCITITNGNECPLIVTTDNVTSIDVSFTTDLSMMNNISVTASNTVGISDPATIPIGGKLCSYNVLNC